MKKILIISLLLVPLSAYGWEPFMNKCIETWIGYPLDSVMQKWGYPNMEREIAGKKLYVWEEYDYDTDTQYGGYTISSTDSKGRETSFTSGGTPKLEFCRKTLEVNENKFVVNGHWEGNACPKFYLIGKKFVNPQNNPWDKK